MSPAPGLGAEALTGNGRELFELLTIYFFFFHFVREQIEVCVSILERLLQAVEPLYLAQNFKEQLQNGLQHPDDSVQILALSQIGRIVEDSVAVTAILNTPELLKGLIQSIGSERILVAKEAIHSLSRVAQSKAGLDALFMTCTLQDLTNVMATSDVIRYRIYELMVEISSVSPVSLGYCVNSGLLSQLINEMMGEDVLIRANAIEMITALLKTPQGRHYLAQQGVINKISNMIIGAASDPFSGFYLPNLVKFFGHLAIMDGPQQICERYPAFVEKVIEMVQGQELTMVGVGLDTLEILGSSIEGKQVLNKTGSAFQDLLRKLGNLLSGANMDVQSRCLDAVASLLYLSADQQTDDLLGMMESWFQALHSRPLEMFRTMSAQPFPEIHIGALKVFTAIAGQPWGQRLMLATPGFMEYIVDRSVEPDKDSKDAKFELVKTLVGSKTTAEILGNQHYLMLRGYLREGPYFVKTVTAVAVEGSE
uniref:26S proteasome non-ATPase regulatory subunit 5 n=1 Tax=Callorhinchus milii TaxID=7868 RepID=A0A4W3IT27_CALMI